MRGGSAGDKGRRKIKIKRVQVTSGRFALNEGGWILPGGIFRSGGWERVHGKLRVTADWFGTEENWELEELQSPGEEIAEGRKGKTKTG